MPPLQTLNVNLSGTGVDIDTLSSTAVTGTPHISSGQQNSRADNGVNGGAERTTGSGTDSATEDETESDVERMRQRINEVRDQRLRAKAKSPRTVRDSGLFLINHKLMFVYLLAQRLSQMTPTRLRCGSLVCPSCHQQRKWPRYKPYEARLARTLLLQGTRSKPW